MQIGKDIDKLHTNTYCQIMIKRDAEKTIHELLQGFPIVTITGPKQSSKTTLAKAIFPDKPYASLEDPDIRLFAQNDPRSFLERFPGTSPIFNYRVTKGRSLTT